MIPRAPREISFLRTASTNIASEAFIGGREFEVDFTALEAFDLASERYG